MCQEGMVATASRSMPIRFSRVLAWKERFTQQTAEVHCAPKNSRSTSRTQQPPPCPYIFASGSIPDVHLLMRSQQARLECMTQIRKYESTTYSITCQRPICQTSEILEHSLLIMLDLCTQDTMLKSRIQRCETRPVAFRLTL